MALTGPSLAFTAALVLLAYLIGSVPFAVVVSKLMGLQDPAATAPETLARPTCCAPATATAAALTLLGDAAKGWFAVWLAEQLAPGITPVLACVVVAAFRVICTRFSWASGARASPPRWACWWRSSPLVATAATWLIIAVFFRYSSLAALVAAFAPVYYVFGSGLVTRSRRWASRWPSSACCCSIATAPTSRA